MAMITVYFFMVLDIRIGDDVRSPRRATAEAIAKAGGTPILDTAVEVEEKELDGNGFVKAQG